MLSLTNFSSTQIIVIIAISTIVTFIVGQISYFIKKHFDSKESKIMRFGLSIETLRDADIQAIETVSYEIRNLSCKYWSEELSDTQLQVIAASIIGRFGYLGTLLRRIFKHDKLKYQTVNRLFVQYQSVCMGQDFLSMSRKINPRILQKIEKLTYDVVGQTANLRRELAFEQIRS